jgi:hypothetical protein
MLVIVLPIKETNEAGGMPVLSVFSCEGATMERGRLARFVRFFSGGTMASMVGARDD